LAEDQIPPEEYWHSQEMLAEWFETVKRRMDSRSKGAESIDIPDSDEDYVDEDMTAMRG